MHIPDVYVGVKTALLAGVVSAAALAGAVARVRRTLPAQKFALCGVLASLALAAQMVNVPIGGGLSGHIVGGALCAVLLGPAAGLLVMTCVLVLQAALFADGGVLTLGVNTLNYGVLGTAGSALIYRSVKRVVAGVPGKLIAAGLAAWGSTLAVFLFCASELAVSGKVGWGAALAVMGRAQLVVGLGEAIITVLVLASIAAVRPMLLSSDARRADRPGRDGGLAVAGFLIALALVVLVAPLGSTLPDGLEHLSRTPGFLDKEAARLAPIPDYSLPNVESPALARALGGAIGTLVSFLSVYGLALLIVPRRPGVAPSPWI